MLLVVFIIHFSLMRLTVVILLCLCCLNAELFKSVAPSASRKESECYVILTLNDKERTVFKSVVDKYDKFVYKGCRKSE